jgi:hypothetical protein
VEGRKENSIHSNRQSKQYVDCSLAQNKLKKDLKRILKKKRKTDGQDNRNKMESKVKEWKPIRQKTVNVDDIK